MKLAHLCLWMTGSLALGLALPGAARAQTRHVVIVSIDGLRPDAIDAARATTMQRLMREGAVAQNARTISPSLTLPSHASMLSGLTPEKHGVDWNKYLPEKGTIKAPTCLDIADRQGLWTEMVVGKEKLLHLGRPGFIAPPARGAEQVGKLAVERLTTHKPSLMMVHFSDPDDAGHRHGWMTPEQFASIRDCDAALEGIIQAIQRTPGLAGHTTIILTADHGGHAKTHGTEMPEDMRIPWIAWGAGVRRGRSRTPMVTYDTAATALYLLGLPVPRNWDGRPQTWAFERRREAVGQKVAIQPSAWDLGAADTDRGWSAPGIIRLGWTVAAARWRYRPHLARIRTTETRRIHHHTGGRSCTRPNVRC